MKLAETSIISIDKGDSMVHMSIAQKQSETGLMFNERLLILHEGNFVGYISKFDLKDNPYNIDLKKIKTQVPSKYIKSIYHDRQNLIIKFLHIQNNKQQQKRWVFKMTSHELTEKWFRILQEQKMKRTKSPEKGNSKQKIQPLQRNSPRTKQNQPIQKEASPQKKQIQKSPNKSAPKIIQEKEFQNQQFVNPLYTGYDSRDSEIVQNVVKNKKDSKIQNSDFFLQTPVKILPPVSQKRQNNLMKEKEQKYPLDFKKLPQAANDKKLKLRTQAQQQNDRIENQENFPHESNNNFIKKPRSSYMQMVQKIVKQSELKTIEKNKSKSHQSHLQDKYQNQAQSYNQVLEQFIRYQTGQTQQWRSHNLRQFQDEENYGDKRRQQLQEVQQYAIKLQKQLQNKTQQSYQQPINYKDFSQQIAMMIRNKRFQRQGQQELSSSRQQQAQPLNIQNMPFSYRFLLATSPAIPVDQREQDEMDVLADWKDYCEELMVRIVCDMVLQEGKFKLKAKKNNIFYFQVDEVQVKIAIASLKEISLNQKQSKKSTQKSRQNKQQNISDYSAAKDLQIEFKNFSALNQLLQKTQLINSKQNSPTKVLSQQQKDHSSRLKVPLTSIVEYCGFIALFKLNPKFSYQQEDINQKYIRDKQQMITQISNIQVKWLDCRETKYKFSNLDENSATNKTLILHVDEDYYAKLHLQRKSKDNQSYVDNKNVTETKKIFDVDFLQQIDAFLLKDYLTKSLTNGVLRKELLEQILDRQQYKDVRFLNPTAAANQTTKSKIEADLALLSGEILQKLSSLILKLDNLQVYYMHPEEISGYFHKEGINIRYMGLAFDNLSEIYAKKFLMTEITARVCKLLLRKTLQDILLNSHSSGQQSTNLNKFISSNSVDVADEVIDFLNCILGSSHESTTIWKVLSQHAQCYFKCELNKDLVDPGYFVTSLVYHCKLKVNWQRLNEIGKVFKTEQFFTRQSLLGLNVQTKTYEPVNSKMYNNLAQLFKYHQNKNISSEQLYTKLISQLHLPAKHFPSGLSSLPNSSPLSLLSLKQFLSQFIRPQTIKLPSSQFNFGNLRVFSDLNQFPQKKSIAIKVTEIKWYLRLKKKDKYLKRFQELVNMLNKFYGDFSPALGELYDVFANFHLQNGEYEDAITFSKSSLVNVMKICGVNHIKTGEAYYSLSVCYLKANKTLDSYNLLKKAKSIYEAKQKTSTHTYSVINMKLGLLMLSRNEISQCVSLIQKALEALDEAQQLEERNYVTKKTSSQISSLYETERTQCFETLSRCYELSKDKQGLKRLSLKMQQNLLYRIKEPINLQKTLRLILYPYFIITTSEDASKYIDTISTITSSNPMQISPRNYTKVYNLIKKRIQEKSLVNNLENYLQNLSSVLDYIAINDSIRNWKSFEQVYERETIHDFIALTDELIYFLGEGYIVGVLREVV